MYTEDRSLQDHLEWEEQILWEWEPDTKDIALEEYLKFGVYVVAASVVLWKLKLVSIFWSAIQTRAVVPAVAMFLVIAVFVYNAISLARKAGLFERRFSMERYVITDRRLLIRNRKNPQWLSISYDKMEVLKVHATGLSIDGSVRNIDVLWLSEKDDSKTKVNVTRMNHVEDWKEAAKRIYSRKFNVPMEEVDLTNNFFQIKVR